MIDVPLRVSDRRSATYSLQAAPLAAEWTNSPRQPVIGVVHGRRGDISDAAKPENRGGDIKPPAFSCPDADGRRQAFGVRPQGMVIHPAAVDPGMQQAGVTSGQLVGNSTGAAGCRRHLPDIAPKSPSSAMTRSEFPLLSDQDRGCSRMGLLRREDDVRQDRLGVIRATFRRRREGQASPRPVYTAGDRQRSKKHGAEPVRLTQVL